MLKDEWDAFVEYAHKLRPQMKEQPEFMYFLYKRHGERIEATVACKAFEEYIVNHPDDRFGNKAWGAFTAHVSAPSMRSANPTDCYGFPSSLKAEVVKQSRAFSAKVARDLQVTDTMLALDDDAIYQGWLRQEYPIEHARVHNCQPEKRYPPGADKDAFDRHAAEWASRYRTGKKLDVLERDLPF